MSAFESHKAYNSIEGDIKKLSPTLFVNIHVEPMEKL